MCACVHVCGCVLPMPYLFLLPQPHSPTLPPNSLTLHPSPQPLTFHSVVVGLPGTLYILVCLLGWTDVFPCFSSHPSQPPSPSPFFPLTHPNPLPPLPSSLSPSEERVVSPVLVPHPLTFDPPVLDYGERWVVCGELQA